MNDEADFSTGTALYYPCIHPRDIHAVKAALLFLGQGPSHCARCGGERGHVQDDEEEARVLTECDLLVSTKPGPHEDAAACADRCWRWAVSSAAGHARTPHLSRARLRPAFRLYSRPVTSTPPAA